MYHYKFNTLFLIVLFIICFLFHESNASVCMHDEMMEKYNIANSKRDTEAMSNNLPLSTQDLNSTYPNASNTNSIRIKFDISAMLDDPYTCYSSGSQVLLLLLS